MYWGHLDNKCDMNIATREVEIIMEDAKLQCVRHYMIVHYKRNECVFPKLL